MSADEVCCQAGQPVELPLSEGGLDNDVLALKEACFLESLTDRVDNFHLGGRSGCQQSDHRHGQLLRARRERPRDRRAAEQRDGNRGASMDRIASNARQLDPIRKLSYWRGCVRWHGSYFTTRQPV